MQKPSYHIFVCNSFRIGGDPQGVCNRKDAVNLLQVLESLRDGRPLNVVDVPPEIKEPARLAVERMLEES